MILSRLSYVRLYLRILTLLLPALAYFAAVKIRFGINFFFQRTPPSGLPSYWGVLLLTTIVWALSAEEAGCWNVEQLYSPAGKSRRLLEALAFTYAIVMAAAFLYRGASYSRTVIAISACALFVFATMARIGFRVFLEFLRRHYKNPVRVLIVGTDRFARRVATSLEHGEVLTCRIAGFVRLPQQEVAVEGPVYEFDNIPKFSNGDSITDVIVALPPKRLSEVQNIAQSLQKLCAPTRVVIDLGETVGIRNRLINLGGIQMLDLRSTLAETGSYLFQKRVFDVVCSLIFLLFTLPVTIPIALAIKLTSRGPIFFVQDRVGLNGRVFRMFKFRTMKLGSREECDTRWTSPNDPRRTAIGAFLRRMNLDELPQFFNVLQGRMSVVGPRPHAVAHNEQYRKLIKGYMVRHKVLPGITGLAQVSGARGETARLEEMERRIRHDLDYLRHWSPALDIRIVLLTALKMFKDEKAY